MFENNVERGKVLRKLLGYKEKQALVRLSQCFALPGKFALSWFPGEHSPTLIQWEGTHSRSSLLFHFLILLDLEQPSHICNK